MEFALIHFGVGLLVVLVIDYGRARLAGESGGSLSLAPVVVGIACAALGHFLSPWATPVVLLLYAAVSINEWLQERRDKKALALRQPKP
ncbi:MAG: hypothetical protein IPN06_12365 [Burkholderiales bacterium]|nr:hypothetical protein [Burkholderiales bacterium]